KNITANFTAVAVTYTLTVTAVNGSVLKDPDQATYLSGTSVLLTATPNSGYTFTGWSGDATGSDNPLTVIMNSNKNITANFTAVAVTYTLTVTAVNGTVVKDPDQATYLSGTSVQLTATADDGYTFSSWSGDATGSGNPLTVVMNSNKNITANFTKNPVGPGAVNLGTAGDFVILTKSGISTTGTTSITGDIGVSPAAASAITGFALIMASNNQYSTSLYVVGKVYAADYAAPTPAKMTTAVSDMETAYTTANGLVNAPIVEYAAGNLNGQTLAPGLYKWGTGVSITTGITLAGGPNDTWVFQIAQDLTVSNSAIITLSGGAQVSNIVWVVAGQAVLGTNVDFSGVILSQTLISLNTGAKVTGRLLAQTAVTLIASTVILP
ncbi:MAG: ice-binding family protein, partial [Bacteroidota bacterium]